MTAKAPSPSPPTARSPATCLTDPASAAGSWPLKSYAPSRISAIRASRSGLRDAHRAVVVAMVTVRVMKMPANQIVRMVAVGDQLVAARGP